MGTREGGQGGQGEERSEGGVCSLDIHRDTSVKSCVLSMAKPRPLVAVGIERKHVQARQRRPLRGFNFFTCTAWKKCHRERGEIPQCFAFAHETSPNQSVREARSSSGQKLLECKKLGLPTGNKLGGGGAGACFLLAALLPGLGASGPLGLEPTRIASAADGRGKGPS
ncbi:hypothetical protein CCMA1212_002797 [Trichoderma ghanense]|uniref:Uncharacterized protein n=1 Tax=Trichoderma ghanense TaxID=65468 RepID=A0ABY2HC76_9HYPO